jgi:hypothetical protein
MTKFILYYLGDVFECTEYLKTMMDYSYILIDIDILHAEIHNISKESILRSEGCNEITKQSEGFSFRFKNYYT